MYRDVNGTPRAVFVRRLRQEYEAGASALELAARHALAYDTVHRMLREAGTSMRPPTRRPANGGRPARAD